ncbi:MAG: phosphate butyryltransferase [Bacteroidales bacterium]|nr:phosphate butyryltransferase [Candidatus Sodaliphilus aphodohippi]
MEAIKNFDAMIEHLSSRGTRKKVAVVWAADGSTQHAVQRALECGFIEAIFVGCRQEIEALEEFKPLAQHISFVDTDDRDEAAALGVSLVREGKADILMKGLINTDNLLHAVLNKETGILPRGNVMTHVTTAQIPGYDRLLFFTDPAVIPYPTHEQRIKQVSYISDLCHSMGIEEPKISLIHCTEKVGEKFFPFTVGYKEIVKMAQDGEFGKCIVDGPLDLKTSCCWASMQTKGIDSPIHGEADAAIFPDIEAGNVFYKTITLFAKAATAGMLQGTIAPVVVPSRADSTECKFYSLAVAAML